MIETYRLLEDMGSSLKLGDWITIEHTVKNRDLLIRHPHVFLKEPIPVKLVYSKLETVNVRTTDEIDSTTQEERNKLVGYCERDDEFTHYDARTDKTVCPKCGDNFSHWQGFQVTTERTFNYTLAKKKKRPKGK